MDLREYLESTTQKEFAERLGVTPGLISQWMVGRAPVPPERAMEIERLTRGMVTRLELRPDVFGSLGIRRRRK
jgi:DNA-binding transcriptional regulator YdaS (Cro superfamily)